MFIIFNIINIFIIDSIFIVRLQGTLAAESWGRRKLWGVDELDTIFIVYLISFIFSNILEILSLQPRRAVDQPRWRGKDQAFQVEEHSLHIQHVSDNKQINKRKIKTNKQTQSTLYIWSTFYIYSTWVITSKQTKEKERQTNNKTHIHHVSDLKQTNLHVRSGRQSVTELRWRTANDRVKGMPDMSHTRLSHLGHLWQDKKKQQRQRTYDKKNIKAGTKRQQIPKQNIPLHIHQPAVPNDTIDTRPILIPDPTWFS